MFFLLREDVTSGCSDATKWTARVGNVVVITRSRDKFRRAKKNSTRGKDTLDVKYSRRDSLRKLWQAFVLSLFPRIFPLKPQFPFSSRFLASKSVLLESSRFPFIARACDAASRFPAKDTCSHIVESHTEERKFPFLAFSLFFFQFLERVRLMVARCIVPFSVQSLLREFPSFKLLNTVEEV